VPKTEYRVRLEERRAARKRRDATLVVQAFEEFINAKVDDKVLNDLESHMTLSEVRQGLIDFLCQQATKHQQD
jgi:hypothetical protein